ncbi:MAG: ATP synthase F1 subunit delta [Crocinitomicaceae bacterium]|nr:ATP synthase F1 subunit delta [Crocinitomicaceae bacterium]
MKGTKVASRFAKSLLELAIEQKSEDKVLKDMELVDELCEESKDFNNLLKNPIINASKKIAITDTIFKGKIEKISDNFINLIIKHNRELYLEEIAESYILQYKEYKGIIDVEVISAIKLDKKTMDSVMEKVKAKYSGTFNIKETVNKDVIGGFILRVGHEQIDMSIARKINDYKHILLQ